MKKKLAIIGASYLQRPLVEKAKEIGLETHVFAWKEGNDIEDISDYFYPISILDKDAILKVCDSIKIDGIVSIGSDIAMPTVNYIASKLGLIANSLESTLISTDKYEMRKALSKAGIPCPRFEFYSDQTFINAGQFSFPVIVKPTDRSGSRGVTKVEKQEGVNTAILKALDNSINGRVIVEEFIKGREFSVESISFNGKHFPLAITDKITTGAPYFVETEHHQPAYISKDIVGKINKEVIKGLDALSIKYGASHSEVFLTSSGEIRFVEIAGRMGGELIGSHMVKLSTGYDFVKGVIDVALNNFKEVDYHKFKEDYSGVYYVLPKAGQIISIEDNSNVAQSVVEAKAILQVGDVIDTIIDGAGKRAGIVVYADSSAKVDLIPNEILKFHTV